MSARDGDARAVRWRTAPVVIFVVFSVDASRERERDVAMARARAGGDDDDDGRFVFPSGRARVRGVRWTTRGA